MFVSHVLCRALCVDSESGLGAASACRVFVQRHNACIIQQHSVGVVHV